MSLDSALKNPDISFTFTGRRWYKVAGKTKDGHLIVVAVGKYAAYPLDTAADARYDLWLEENHKRDPLFHDMSVDSCQMVTIDSLTNLEEISVSVQVHEVAKPYRRYAVTISHAELSSTR